MESIFNLRKDTLACRADSLPTGARPRKRSRSGIRPKIATSLTLNQARGNKTVLRYARHDLLTCLQTPVARSHLHLVLSQPCIVIVKPFFSHTHTRFSPHYCRRLLTHDTPIRAAICCCILQLLSIPFLRHYSSFTIPFLLFSPSLPVATCALPGVNLKRHLRSRFLLLPSASPPAAHCLLCTTTPSGHNLVQKLGSLIRLGV